jgi:chromosome segregation ATPase
MQALVDAWVAMTREYLKKATGSFQQVQDRLITYEQQNFGPMLVQLSGHFADQAKQALADQKQKEVELNHQLIATRKEVESAIQKASKHEVDAAKLKEKSESLDSRVKQLERERAELDKSSKAIEQQLRVCSQSNQIDLIDC